MSRYQMQDGVVVDTKKALDSWAQETDWDGSNRIGRSTRSQWIDQTLYCSAKGRYYLETSPRIDCEQPHAEWVSNKDAARWLILNEHDLPDDLEALAEEVSE